MGRLLIRQPVESEFAADFARSRARGDVTWDLTICITTRVLLLLSACTLSACTRASRPTPRAVLSEPGREPGSDREQPIGSASNQTSDNRSESADPLSGCTRSPLMLDDPELAPIALSTAEERRLTFIDNFVKNSGSASVRTVRVPADISGSPQELIWDVPSAKYERAKLLFEKRHYSEAALAFREFTFAHPDRAESIYTSQLYLEALNAIATRASPKRAECYQAMAADLTLFKQIYCDQPIAPEHREYCQTLESVERELRALRGR